MDRSRDSAYVRLSDPPSIGLVLDADGNPKYPFTQRDVELRDMLTEAKKELKRTGDKTKLREYFKALREHKRARNAR